MSIKKLSDAAAMMVVAAMVGCSPNDTTVNIALNKAAYASSSYDYNLTAQLVTDGGVAASEPAWLKVCTAEGATAREGMDAGRGTIFKQQVGRCV